MMCAIRGCGSDLGGASARCEECRLRVCPDCWTGPGGYAVCRSCAGLVAARLEGEVKEMAMVAAALRGFADA